MKNKRPLPKTLLVSYVDEGYKEPLLVVGTKKEGEAIKILNAFQGDHAHDIMAILTGDLKSIVLDIKDEQNKSEKE